MSLNKKKENKVRQEFLLSFFKEQNQNEHYEEKEINGFWLIKQKNNDNNSWQVAIYSQESYKNYKEYKINLAKIQNYENT